MYKKYFLCLSTAILGVSVLSACSVSNKKKSEISWKQNQQMILVLSSGWNANHGELLRFQYKNHQWIAIGMPFPVSLGKNGAAWGEGIHPSVDNGIIKKEGDMRSPAGIFSIGYSFGYAQQVNSSYPYKALTKNDYCIDNSQSPYYNQIINQQQIFFDIAKDSTEPMRRDLYLKGDQLYKLGFVLKYNVDNKPQAGSCIFVHLRAKSNATTAGCVSMEEENMQKILSWLNEQYNPVFVLLPLKAYQQQKQLWNLPIVKKQTKFL